MRVGETRKMNCGLIATIMAYRTAQDIDVKFKDNALVEHTDYASFRNGKVAHPIMDAPNYSKLGLTKRMNCGKDATIINYQNHNDIDVLFVIGNNEIKLEHVTYDEFKEGTLSWY